MQHRILGRTGLSVSEIGFGGAVVGITNYLGRHDPADPATAAEVEAALDRALDLGLNFLDTAPAYGNGIGEELYGRVIGRRRAECILSTKFGARDPEGIRHSCEASLRRLRTDVIDILQFHGGYYDPPEIARILDGGGLETLEALRDEGKVRYIGFTAEAPTEGLYRLVATGRFDVMQIRYNVMYQNAYDLVNHRGIMQEAEKAQMGITLMRPLASGLFQRWLQAAAPELLAAADWHRLLLDWVLSNRLVDVAIVGMRTVAEVEQNNALSEAGLGTLDLEALHHRQFAT